MTKRHRILALDGFLLVCGMFPWTTAQEDEKVSRYSPSISIFSQDILIPKHVVQRAPVVCVGCSVKIEGDVRDNVVVIFGELEMDGASVRDNVVGVFSTMTIRDTPVGENLVNVLGTLDADEFVLNPINIGWPFGWAPRVHTLVFWFRAVGLLLTFIALIAAVSIAPERVEVLAREAPVRYFSAFFAGLLGYLAFLMVISLLTATIIGLPAGILFFKVLKWVGIAGIFLSLGQRVGRSLGREMSPLGAVLLSFGLYAAIVIALSWLGVVGFFALILFHLFFWLMFEVPAVGLVILTRFGTRAGGGAAIVVPPPQPATPPGAPAGGGEEPPADRES